MDPIVLFTTFAGLFKENPKTAALLLALWVLSSLLGWALGHKSQIDAWAEQRPRLAGVLKLLRSFGFDPWLFAQAVSLVVKGRLPPKLQAEKAKAERDKDDGPPPTKPSGGIGGLMLMLCFVLVACSGQPDPKSPSAMCPDLELGAIMAECEANVARSCGVPAKDDCPEKAECHRQVSAWHACNPEEGTP